MLIGIICRYPDKENNYIYSLDEMAEYDFGLLFNNRQNHLFYEWM